MADSLLDEADITELDCRLAGASSLSKIKVEQDEGQRITEGLVVEADGLARCRLYWAQEAGADVADALYLTVMVDGQVVLEPNSQSRSTPIILHLSTEGREVRIRIERGEALPVVEEMAVFLFSAGLAVEEEEAELTRPDEPGGGLTSLKPDDPGPGVVEIRLKPS